ncbi:MAG: DUF4258 domain-containing protein [Defluviitaleaceae bacterium]|nr:DUF4258 domain-containing protein [Defluviitaleaceae bacterium]MCL2263802.1 DUF4258 domain-containing protein [Defluviitaleaceae bacterium]
MIDLSGIQSCVSAGNILWTEHISLRLRERKLKRADILNCVKNGKIIEQYPNDTPYPSCLIFGYTINNQPLHIVCGLDFGKLCCMITAYVPNLDTWQSDFQTRKDK